MNRQHGRNALTLAGSVTLVLAAAATGAQQGSTRLEEVLVTAQKRAEAIAEVPMSISVVTGEALERGQADNF
ncbi:MAG: hypothetical protein ACREVI_00850 [Steroidobacteraceae bacterium]